jgi:integrase
MPSDLTLAEIANLKPGVHRVATLLYLVNKPPRRSWIMIYTSPITGRRTEMGLGPCEVLTTARAKALVLKHRVAIHEGRCPLAERRANRAARDPAAKTFRDVADLYETAHRQSWRSGEHAAQWTRSMVQHVFPQIGGLPVRLIGTAEIMAVLEPIWHATPASASRLRGRIERVLDYAASRHWRSGDNPARWRGHIENLLPHPNKLKPPTHLAALDWQGLPALWCELAAKDTIPALAVKLMLLTATRRSEAMQATWDEIDTGRALWTIPADRMKGGRQHRVALSTGALEVLDALAALRMGEHVFPGTRIGKPLWGAQPLVLLRTLRPEATLHGFRSGFSDWARHKGIPTDVKEMALAHAIPDKTRAAYDRDDLLEARRPVMQRWAAYLAGVGD